MNSSQPVAIVTGGGRGLGRCHADALVAAATRSSLNDLGVARDGTGAERSVARRPLR